MSLAIADALVALREENERLNKRLETQRTTIEILREENERLREALSAFRDTHDV